MKSKYINLLIALLGLIPMIIWSVRYLNVDLWYDEVYSLEHFVLTDFSTTLFYYPAPNNHIFFNITSQIISRISGLRDIFSIEENSYIFRIFQLLISLGTAYFSMRIIKRFFNFKNSFLVIVLLFTSIPFMNFALQLRGYNMSSLFLVMLVYYCLNYIELKKKANLIYIATLSVLLLWTIPSNLYVLVSCWFSIAFLWFYFRKQETGKLLRTYLNPLLFISIGVVVSALLYLPIWRDVIFNKFSSRAFGTFYMYSVVKAAIPEFFSSRYLLLILILPGLYYFYIKRNIKEKSYFLFFISLFVIPLGVAFLHQKAPFSRVFIALAPIFAIIITAAILKFLETRNFSFLHNRIILTSISVYCISVFVYEMNKNDKIIAANLVENEELSQDLYRNFYLASNYKLDATIKQLAENRKEFPVVKMFQEDEPATNLYLRKYAIPYSEENSVLGLKPFLEKDNGVIILSTYRNRILNSLDSLKGIKVKVLTDTDSFSNLIQVENE